MGRMGATMGGLAFPRMKAMRRAIQGAIASHAGVRSHRVHRLSAGRRTDCLASRIQLIWDIPLTPSLGLTRGASQVPIASFRSLQVGCSEPDPDANSRFEKLCRPL